MLLNNMNLTGPIPMELYQLTGLVHLQLANNSLAGTISPKIADLNNLTVLRLQGNRLSGSLPLELGQLMDLGSLQASNNLFSGLLPSIPFAQYAEGCWLDGNQFTCPLPEYSSMCQNGPPTCSAPSPTCPAGTCAQAGCTQQRQCLASNGVCYAMTQNDCYANRLQGFCWCG
jgi:hypothetical protein